MAQMAGHTCEKGGNQALSSQLGSLYPLPIPGS